MRKIISVSVIMIVIISVISISCNDQTKAPAEKTKIENTLKSVSFFQDSVGHDPLVLLEAFTTMNEAIDEIGYPDAGYKVWLIQSDTSDVRFLVEGFWPNQDVYNEIHDHQLYKEAAKLNENNWDGLISLEYHRFKKIK